MFINLTNTSDKKIYYNTNDIRKIYREEDRTVLVLTYGVDIVKERPEIITEMVKGAYHEVFHAI